MTEAPSTLFVGRHGQLGATAVQVALRAELSGNVALLFGSIASLNGAPFWQLRRNISALYRVSTRTITRYFRALQDAGLIENKPAPLKAVPPGAKTAFPFRPWYKWAIGLPQIRQQVERGSKETYNKWVENFEKQRQETANRSKFASILGELQRNRTYKPPPRPDVAADARPPRQGWTAEELDAELARIPVGSTLDPSPVAQPPPD